MSANYRLPQRPTVQEQRPVSNLLELLDRILDKGVVIIGDVKISVANIELLKIQIRLLIASVDKAKELGIDFGWARGLGDSPPPARRLAGGSARRGRLGSPSSTAASSSTRRGARRSGGGG